MNRRDFLKASMAAFVSAMIPLEQGDKKSEALVLGGFVAEEENFLYYVMPQGIMTFDDTVVGMMFTDLVMSVRIGKKQGPPSPNVDCTFGRVVAPLPVSTVFFDQLGDVQRAKNNIIKIGVVKTDGTPLWFKLSTCLIDSTGISVVTTNKIPTEGMGITQFVHLTAYSEPEITEKPNITPQPISEERLKKADPNWPNVIDLHEHLVEAWRQHDRNKV